MKRTLSFLAVALLALSLASPALATDGIGVFRDEAATQNCATGVPVGILTLYVVARDIHTPDVGLAGWECAFQSDPVLPMVTVNLRYNALNVLAYPNFNVGLPAVGGTGPGSTFVVADFVTFYQGGPLKIGIGPCTPTSFEPDYIVGDTHPEATPGYAQGDDPGFLWRLYPTSFVPTGTEAFYWVCYINVDEPCPGSPVPAVQDSWGSVKSLYQ